METCTEGRQRQSRGDVATSREPLEQRMQEGPSHGASRAGSSSQSLHWGCRLPPRPRGSCAPAAGQPLQPGPPRGPAEGLLTLH